MRWLQQPHSHPYSVGNYPTVISYLLLRNSSGVGNSGGGDGGISCSRCDSSGSGGGKGSGTSIFSSNGSGGGGSNGSGSSDSGYSSGIGGWCWR